MQPFQCDLQQQLQEPHRTTHTGTTNRCKTHRRNNSRMKRPQPHPPHRRGTFLRHMQTLYTEKHTVSCPGFLPKHYPCNIHAAIPMRSCNQRFKNRIELRTQEQPLVAKHIGGTSKGNQPQHRRGTFRRRLQWLYTEKHNFSCCGFLTQKPMQHSFSHSNAICNHSFKNRIELRTQEQPLFGKRIGGTIRAWNDPSRTRRTEEVPFIAGCSHFRRKTQGFVLRLPRNIAHETFMQPFQCDHATRNSRTAANRNSHSLQNT